MKKKSQSRNFQGFSGVFLENFKGFCQFKNFQRHFRGKLFNFGDFSGISEILRISGHPVPYNIILILKRYKTPFFLSTKIWNSNIHQENRDSPNLTLFHLKQKYCKNFFVPFAIADIILKIVLNLHVSV